MTRGEVASNARMRMRMKKIKRKEQYDNIETGLWQLFTVAFIFSFLLGIAVGSSVV